LRLTLRSFSLRDSPVRVTAPYALSPLFEASGPRSSRVATIVSESFHRSLDLKALLHREVRCRPASVATDGLPDAPLGLVPCLVLNAWPGLIGSIGPEGILVPKRPMHLPVPRDPRLPPDSLAARRLLRGRMPRFAATRKCWRRENRAVGQVPEAQSRGLDPKRLSLVGSPKVPFLSPTPVDVVARSETRRFLLAVGCPWTPFRGGYPKVPAAIRPPRVRSAVLRQWSPSGVQNPRVLSAF
jgi:hypothetical protein